MIPMATLTTIGDTSLRNRGTILGMTGKLLVQTHTKSNGMLRNMSGGRHPLRTLSGSTPSLAHKDLTLVTPTIWELTQRQHLREQLIHLGLKLSTAALPPKITQPITNEPKYQITSATMLGILTLQSQAPLNGVTVTFTRIFLRTRLIFTKTVMLTATPRDLSSPLWAFSWVSCTP